MDRKKVTLVSLASAIAAIAPSNQSVVHAMPLGSDTAPTADPKIGGTQPNAFYNIGDELMGLVATTQPDGTVLAQHYSHASHASHSSHASHYSSGR